MTQRKSKKSNTIKWAIRIGIGLVIVFGLMFLVHMIVQLHQ